MLKKLLCALMFIPAFAAQAEQLPVKMAKENGIKTCLPALSEIAKNQIGDNEHNTFITYYNKTPDKRMYTAQTVIELDDGNSMYHVVHTVPDNAGRCDWAQSLVFGWDKSCKTVRETILTDWYVAENMGKAIRLAHKNDRTNIILLPANVNVCVGIKTGVMLSK